MKSKKQFNSAPAHEYFSKICFNAAWDLIDKTNRSTQENEEMIHMSHSSLYHWSQRSDCTDQNISIGYWQLSRVYALIGEVNTAVRYGHLCLDYSKKQGVAEMFLGYAYEALARAYAMVEEEEKKIEFIKKATKLAKSLSPEDKAQLLGDLDTID